MMVTVTGKKTKHAPKPYTGKVLSVREKTAEAISEFLEAAWDKCSGEKVAEERWNELQNGLVLALHEDYHNADHGEANRPQISRLERILGEEASHWECPHCDAELAVPEDGRSVAFGDPKAHSNKG